MGSGSGAATLVLARDGAIVTAVDMLPALLDRLERKVVAGGLNGRVRTLRVSMLEVPVSEGPFDLIWSEGEAYAAGFEAALGAWRGLLRPGGYVVASELSWLVDEPPAEVRDYWTAAYPGIGTVERNARIVAGAGYRCLGSFLLPDAAWEAFYAPQRVRCREWRARRMAPEEETLVREMEEEIRLHEAYRSAYDYVFYLMRLPG
jgi:SAM-dependent methyltransferase